MGFLEQVQVRRHVRLLALFCAAFAAGCHRTFPEAASVIRMGDLTVANQLTSGFYSAEGTGWRWTAKHFSVILKPPSNPSRGITLNMSLFIPGTQIAALGPMTLQAAVGKCALAPETFSKTGSYTYTRDIPAQEANTNILPIGFSFDRANNRIRGESRELAAIVKSISVQPK